MNKGIKTLVVLAIALGVWAVTSAQQVPPPSLKPPSLKPPAPPNLPKSIPPPPMFASQKNDNGKFQFVSASYHSYGTDGKSYLYQRLLKVDTTTGEALVLRSTQGLRGEVRQWVKWEVQ